MAYFHKGLKYHEDTKVKRAINKEDIDFLKALQKERNTQDNCGTADVRTWVIKDRKDRVTAEGHEDYYVFYNSEDCNCLDLEDIYNILRDLQNMTDYYTDETVITNLRLNNEGITFEYLDKESSIRPDNNNPDGLQIKGVYVDELIEFINDNGYEIDIVNMIVSWEQKFCFLTQKAAENYLCKYGYNHSEDAHTYCICTYRDPEIARLMDIIETVDWGKLAVNNVSI